MEDTRSAWALAGEAFRSFRLREYAPFGWLLAAELIALGLAMNLGTPAGMATAGWIAERVAGDGPLHYPVFYVFLPNLMQIIEAFLYTIPGSLLIPLSVIRIARNVAPYGAPEAPPLAARPGETRVRVLRAFPAVLVGSLLVAALLFGWQWVLGQREVVGAIRGLVRGGLAGTTLLWLVGSVVAYSFLTVFLYVPVAAVRPGHGFARALGAGVRAGLALFFPTLLVVLAFSLPAAVVLYVTQVFGRDLVQQVRPEINGILVGIYLVLSSLASYFIYGAAVRLFESRRAE